MWKSFRWKVLVRSNCKPHISLSLLICTSSWPVTIPLCLLNPPHHPANKARKRRSACWSHSLCLSIRFLTSDCAARPLASNYTTTPTKSLVIKLLAQPFVYSSYSSFLGFHSGLDLGMARTQKFGESLLLRSVYPKQFIHLGVRTHAVYLSITLNFLTVE